MSDTTTHRQPDLLTSKEVCAVLRTNRWTLREFVTSGRLRAYRLGVRRLLRFDVRDVQSFVAAGLVRA